MTSTTPDADSMWVEVQMVGVCPRCGSFVPVNALVGRVTCPSCGMTLSISAEQWADILEQILEAASTARLGESASFDLDLPDWPLRVSWRRRSWSRASRFSRTSQGGPGTPTIPPEISHLVPSLRALADEDTRLYPLEDPGIRPADLRIVGLKERAVCPNCGALLPDPIRERTLSCPECGTRLAVPDTLWYRLHPIVETRAWFLVFGPAASS